MDLSHIGSLEEVGLGDRSAMKSDRTQQLQIDSRKMEQEQVLPILR